MVESGEVLIAITTGIDFITIHVTYPQNYWGQEYYRSYESLYHRYPQEMRVPAYNTQWHNFYPQQRRYHWGHHFRLDVF